jgi:hypothetical protein
VTVTTKDALFVPKTAMRVAAIMVRFSHKVCAGGGHGAEDRLGWYASGGSGCDVPEGLAASRNRTALAGWLTTTLPFPGWVSAASTVDQRPKRPLAKREGPR